MGKEIKVKDMSRFLILPVEFQDKAPYVEKAEKRKSEYDKNMQAYNKKMVKYFVFILQFCCFPFEL